MPGGADDGAAADASYCGKIRSFNLSGANFVCYDDGAKPGQGGGRTRRQMLAVTFNKVGGASGPACARRFPPLRARAPSR